ncbi:hypothetical protein KJ660_01785 [Candidatus Micrarchaeota archaeon]|nr:hypothetical protein [Candidatus Micrarchaeota archaeon]
MDERILSIDLHTHLIEKKISPIKFWYSAIQNKLNGVAITEHADCKPEKAFRLLNEIKPENLLLIPGMEINTNKGHLLAYAFDEGIYEVKKLTKKNISLEEVIDSAKENSFLLSFSHPYGFSYDSAGYVLGTGKLIKLLRREAIGVEIYNGMIAYLSDFLYDSNWIRRPYNFFGFLEKNFIAKKTGVWRVGEKVKKSLDKRRMDVVNRCLKAIELGKEASFITAGSDAHTEERIGAGIIKLRIEGEGVEGVLENLKEKENLVWSGPLVKEISPGVYEKVVDPLRKKEIAQGIRYATKELVKKRIQRKKKKGN